MGEVVPVHAENVHGKARAVKAPGGGPAIDVGNAQIAEGGFHDAGAGRAAGGAAAGIQPDIVGAMPLYCTAYQPSERLTRSTIVPVDTLVRMPDSVVGWVRTLTKLPVMTPLGSLRGMPSTATYVPLI